MTIFYVFISIVLVILFNNIISRKIQFSSLLDYLLIQYLLVVSNIIITFEFLSLINKVSDRLFFIIVQAGLLLLCLIISFIMKEEQKNKQNIFNSFRIEFYTFYRDNKFLFFTIILVLITYIGLAIYSTLIPPNTTDVLYNHLSRIGHWLQQGNLNPYPAFTRVGIVYPYNNSLLMMWSVLFLGTDKFVGFVQWFALLFLALGISGIARTLFTDKSNGAFASIIFLTFPIVIFQSTTAQNDILVASFFVIGFYFLICGFRASSYQYIFFSAMSFALAIGTKQTAFFLVPGALVIFLFESLLRKKTSQIKMGIFYVLCIICLTFCLGSYTYIQNQVVFKDPSGMPPDRVSLGINEWPQLLLINSTRLFTQFISCEGVPVPIEDKCLSMKNEIFSKLGRLSTIIESGEFQQTPCGIECFDLGYRYPQNEESSWFGILSWGLLLTASMFGLILSIREKNVVFYLLIFMIASAFLISIIVKSRWEPYQGRYYIILVALLAPLLSFIYTHKKFTNVISKMILSLSIFILFFSILNNDSKTLVCKTNLFELEVWGKENNPLIQKIAYKLSPLFRNEYCISKYSKSELRTYFDSGMFGPLMMVETNTPSDSSLGIVANNGYISDYLFFGSYFQRRVYDFPEELSNSDIQKSITEKSIEFILVNTNRQDFFIPNIKLIAKSGDWQLFLIN